MGITFLTTKRSHVEVTSNTQFPENNSLKLFELYCKFKSFTAAKLVLSKKRTALIYAGQNYVALPYFVGI